VNGGMEDPIVVISGLSNTYSGYIATFEEYHVQRYEGASTIFGPHTLSAYQQIFATLADSLVYGTPLPESAVPRNLTGDQISFHPPVVWDTVPLGKKFGALYKDAEKSYQIGQEVQVVFYGANPRNNLMTGESFSLVEQLDANNQNWTIRYTDADWDTKFEWASHDIAESLITITWNITVGSNTPGQYRISHFGYAKEDPVSSKLTAYSGSSSVFSVTN